jgi:hypothetical protein
MAQGIEIKVGGWTGRMTLKQLEQVILVAGSGHGDGELYLDTGSPYGGRRMDGVYNRGIDLLTEAMLRARGKRHA